MTLEEVAPEIAPIPRNPLILSEKTKAIGSKKNPSRKSGFKTQAIGSEKNPFRKSGHGKRWHRKSRQSPIRYAPLINANYLCCCNSFQSAFILELLLQVNGAQRGPD
uniref:Uncharacterized protein n=1 Tax=Vespula pensylvanica TaxID=30213 RepID=A0A834U790_VESPE|nr:hypothetical protein H0235_010171 [Vespula pensylvanica]